MRREKSEEGEERGGRKEEGEERGGRKEEEEGVRREKKE